MLRHRIRDLGLRYLPGPMLALTSWRSQRIIMAIERSSGVVEGSQAFVARHGRTVLDGPFRGMTYPQATAHRRNLVPKLLGSYESEIHGFVETALARPASMVVNVGSADGYYSVGLALRRPNVPLVAFDTDLWARRATAALARENRAANVTIKGMCTPQWLARNLTPGALVVSDCEGFEAVLLDPEVAPRLAGATILVELHDHAAPGIAALLRRRFEATHAIAEVAWEARSPAAYPLLADLAQEKARALLSEGRGAPQSWLLLTTP